MSWFEDDTHFPRASGSGTWRPLRDLYGKGAEQLIEIPIDLKRAEFHPAGGHRVTESRLLEWRADLNDWAYDNGFPAKLNGQRSSDWNVALGLRLVTDTRNIPEALHPAVWCWLATNLLPHLVVHRWGWPALVDGEPPDGREQWARFGLDLRNGLRLAVHRIVTYGPELARRATEQEFQSIQYRPAFGLDQRVARLVLWSLVEAVDDPRSNYGKHGGDRTNDANDVCIELRVVNSLRPLCFASDSQVVRIVHEIIDRLPTLRRRPPEDGEPSSVP